MLSTNGSSSLAQSHESSTKSSSNGISGAPLLEPVDASCGAVVDASELPVDPEVDTLEELDDVDAFVWEPVA